MDIPDALEVLGNCPGFVLTGGADIHPAHHGKGEEENRSVLRFALFPETKYAFEVF